MNHNFLFRYPGLVQFRSALRFRFILFTCLSACLFCLYVCLSEIREVPLKIYLYTKTDSLLPN